MVEPRRRCFSLPAVELRKKAVSGVIHVSVVSASKLTKSSFKGSPSRKQQGLSDNDSSEEHFDDKDLQTFVEVELEHLTRKTNTRQGSNPIWNSTFNMALHEDTGNLRFNLYNCSPSSVKFDYMASCEIKVCEYVLIPFLYSRSKISFFTCKKIDEYNVETSDFSDNIVSKFPLVQSSFLILLI